MLKTLTAFLLVSCFLMAMDPLEARSDVGFEGSWNLSLNFITSYSSSPDRRTRNEGSAALTVDASLTHNYKRSVVFVVFELVVALEGEPVSLSPYAHIDDTEKATLPFADRRDVGVGLLWLDAPWPPRTKRDVSFKVPSLAKTYFMLASEHKKNKKVEQFLLPHIVGYDIKDAIPLLADVVVRESDRKELARKLSHALGHRYRYLADDGHWKLPDYVPVILPPAPWSEQLSVRRMPRTGHTEKGARIVFVNRASGSRNVRVSGYGGTQWITVQPDSRAVVEVGLEPMSWVEALAGVPSVKTWTLAVLEQKRRYPNEPEISNGKLSVGRLIETLDKRYVTYTMRLDGGYEYLMEIGSK